MAGREQEVLELREEYIKNGCKLADINDAIDAWRLNKANLSQLRAALGKLSKEKKVFAAPTAEESRFTSVITSTYQTGSGINETFNYTIPKIISKSTLINQTYYLEDQGIIDEQLRAHQEFLSLAYQENYNIRINSINDSTDQDVWIAGRIELRDDDEEEEYFLVTGTETYRLVLSELTEYVIYPGQVIMVQGRVQNADFLVKAILTDPLKTASVPINAKSKLQIAVLSGPFTDQSLDFSHFLTVVSQLSKQVNLIIIIGPIVDCENEKIKSLFFKVPGSEIENSTYEQLLAYVLASLNSLKSCKILIVPHERETCHLFPLPMPELNKTFPFKSDAERSGGFDNLHTCPAPGFLDVDGLSVHIVPFDIVNEIIQSLKFKSSVLPNKTQTAANQLIQQRTYLPVIPNNLPVEYTKFIHFCPENIPNILILNSRLTVKPDIVPGVTIVRMVGYFDGKNIGNYTIITSAPDQNNLLVGVKNFRAEFN